MPFTTTRLVCRLLGGNGRPALIATLPVKLPALLMPISIESALAAVKSAVPAVAA
jgi:hypothetical protein